MLELVAAALLTIVATWLHVTFAQTAGGLWRDEANTVRLATLPTVGEVWRNIEFDSFPALWHVVVRLLRATEIDSDTELRALGAAIGALVLAVIWFNAWALGTRLPLLALPLVALCPSIIVWGDSMRAYGFGLVLILATASLVWLFVERPTTSRYVAAALVAIASVQTVYTNAAYLLVICVAAGVVAARSRRWRITALVLSIGLVSAVSLLPYVPALRRAAGWNELVRVPHFELATFVAKVTETLASGAVAWGWTVLLATGVMLALVVQRRESLGNLPDDRRNRALFALVLAVGAVVALFGFLKLLRYPTEPWYYLACLALLGTSIDAMFAAATGRGPAGRLVVLCVGCVLGALAIQVVSGRPTPRMTNVDLIAREIQRRSLGDDLVVVSPWYYGVSYHRYAGASPRYVTVPSIESAGWCRCDQVKREMTRSDQSEPVREVLREIEATLRAGRVVFVVGRIGIFEPHADAARLGPAPSASTGWSDRPYLHAWEAQVLQFVERHCQRREKLSAHSLIRLSDYENLMAFAADGWRE